MAIYTVANGGGNINAGATYVGGIAPSSTDTIDFTATSGQLTVNTPFTIAGINFTNYVNTITMTGTLTVNGNVTLSSGMSISGGGNLSINATATLTSNGKTWTTPLVFLNNTTPTITFADDWTITSTFNVNGGPYVFNGNTLNLGGNVTINQATSGTTNFIYNGTGTWSGAGAIRNNFTINTSGTITISGTVAYNTGTLTYTSGTVITTGSTLSIAASTTLNISGINLNNISFSGTTTVTLLSDLNVYGVWSVINPLTLNGFNINIYGGIGISSSSQGTTVVNALGTGTFNINVLYNSVNFNTVGTITFTSGSIWTCGGGTITYISGNIITSNHTLSISSSTTLNTNGIVWNNVNNFSTGIVTLTSDLYFRGIFRTQTASGTINGFTMYCSGSLLVDTGNNSGGTTAIILNGTGTWSGAGTLKNNLTINTSGTITISGTVYYNTGTLTYISGNVETGGSTLTIGASTTLDTNGINWNNLTTSTTNPVVTLLSDLNIKGNLTTSASNQQFNGAFNVNVSGNLTIGGTATLGTAQLNLIGIGVWSAGVGTTFSLNTTIKANANIILGSLITYQTGILTIEKQARITTRFNSALTIANSCTLININKCNFKTVTVSSNQTLTMNEFFSGRPDIKTNVRITGGTSPYKITFTDEIPKKAFHVNTQYCTINNRNQLNIINRDANGGFNQGILFGESGMSGIPLNMNPTEMSYPTENGLINNMIQ